MGRGRGAAAAGPVVRKPSCKLRVLHWKKLAGPKVAGTVWESAPVPKEEVFPMEELERLFADKAKEAAKVDPEAEKKKAAAKAKEKITLLDDKRARSVGIGLSRFRSMQIEELAQCVRNLDSTTLVQDDFEELLKLLPTPEEIELVKAFQGDVSMLATPERFFHLLSPVPLLYQRVSSFVFALQYDERAGRVRDSLAAISQATEVATGKAMSSVLGMVLTLGNSLNCGTFAGNARGAELASILKLREVKAADNSVDLLQFIIRKLKIHQPDFLELQNSLEIAATAGEYSFTSLEAQVSGLQTELEAAKKLVAGTHETEEDKKLKEALDHFLTRVGDEPKALMDQVNQAKEQFAKLSKQFGEPVTAEAPADLFTVFHRFGRQLRAAAAELHNREVEERQREKRKEEMRVRAEARRKPTTRRQRLSRKVDPAVLTAFAAAVDMPLPPSPGLHTPKSYFARPASFRTPRTPKLRPAMSWATPGKTAPHSASGPRARPRTIPLHMHVAPLSEGKPRDNRASLRLSASLLERLATMEETEKHGSHATVLRMALETPGFLDDSVL